MSWLQCLKWHFGHQLSIFELISIKKKCDRSGQLACGGKWSASLTFSHLKNFYPRTVFFCLFFLISSILSSPDFRFAKLFKACVLSFVLFFPVCSRAEMVRRAVRNSWVGFYPSGRREPCMRITCSISSRKSCVSSTSQNLYQLVSSAYHSIIASVLCA